MYFQYSQNLSFVHLLLNIQFIPHSDNIIQLCDSKQKKYMRQQILNGAWKLDFKIKILFDGFLNVPFLFVNMLQCYSDQTFKTIPVSMEWNCLKTQMEDCYSVIKCNSIEFVFISIKFSI